MTTAISVFNDEVTKFTRTIILETISKWLRANKGVDVSVDELSIALNMEFRVTPSIAASSISVQSHAHTQAPKATRSKSAFDSEDLDPYTPCQYRPTKGEKKNIPCGKPSFKGTSFCPTCWNKGQVKKYYGPPPSELLAKQAKKESAKLTNRMPLDNMSSALSQPLQPPSLQPFGFNQLRPTSQPLLQPTQQLQQLQPMQNLQQPQQLQPMQQLQNLQNLQNLQPMQQPQLAAHPVQPLSQPLGFSHMQPAHPGHPLQPAQAAQSSDILKFKQQTFDAVSQLKPGFNFPMPQAMPQAMPQMTTQFPNHSNQQDNLSVAKNLKSPNVLPNNNGSDKNVELIRYGDKYQEPESGLIVTEDNGMYVAVSRLKSGKEEPLSEDDKKLAQSKGFHLRIDKSPVNTDLILPEEPSF
jgi:hypothetical protein